jgi:hypothetical protein
MMARFACCCLIRSQIDSSVMRTPNRRLDLKRVLIGLLILLSSAPSAILTAQSPRTLRDELVGTWRLVAAHQTLADGSVRPDPQTGPRGVGYIMYDVTGHVCVVLTNPDRPAWKMPASPTDAEIRSAMDGLVAYCGTYDTNEQLHYVIHHIEADRYPSIVGTDRTRRATVTGDRLMLRPVDLPAGVKDWTVEWQRVGGTQSTPHRP